MGIIEKGLLLQKKYKTILELYGVNTPLRLSHFFSQISHESGLKPISENLNYSEDGLLNTFGKYFNKTNVKLYARKPEKIANRVYANRMGNGNESSGEGWKFRGRGFIQITGRENYTKLSNDTEIDFINNPDLLLTEPNALLSALWYWNSRGLNKFADKDDVITITKRINGGTIGLNYRIKKVNKYKQLLK